VTIRMIGMPRRNFRHINIRTPTFISLVAIATTAAAIEMGHRRTYHNAAVQEVNTFAPRSCDQPLVSRSEACLIDLCRVFIKSNSIGAPTGDCGELYRCVFLVRNHHHSYENQ
jgi:hypothetical protein